MRRFLAIVVLAALAALPAALPVAPASADGGYTPDVPTSCRITVPSAPVGERVVLRVRVTAATSLPVTGDVEVTISRRAAAARAARVAGAAPVWTTTARYEGEPLRIVGPRLSRGDHIATVRFTPDSETFTGCNDAVRFRVGGDVGGEREDDGSFLPDTGGPQLGLLIGGLVLLVAGGGLVVASRRESMTPGAA